MHLNLLWLAAPEIMTALASKFDQYSPVKLHHLHRSHLSGILDLLIEDQIDLIVMETDFLRHPIDALLFVLPENSSLKLLVAQEPQQVFFAFGMKINHCFGFHVKTSQIKRIIDECIATKERKTKTEPFEQKLLLPHETKEEFRIIHWKDLISFHKNKNKTMLYRVGKKPLPYPMPYDIFRQKHLSKILFYPLTENCTVNLNHLRTINYVQNNDYHCLLSDGRIVEIDSKDRTRLLRFLKKKTE